MTNAALSTISGRLQKRLVLGTLTPVVIFLAAGVMFVGPMLPFWHVSVRTLLNVNTIEFVSLTFVLLALTGTLYNLNVPIIRFLEGYSWADSWFGKQRIAAHVERFDALQNRWTVLQAADDPRSVLRPESRADFNRFLRGIAKAINEDYPRQRGSVLPTRLGNVIRSFETYADNQYGIASVALWPRLMSVVEPRHADAIDDAQTILDFMVNSCVLGALAVVGLVFVALVYPAYGYVPRAGSQMVLLITGFAAVSYAGYLGAITQAYSWGAGVKAAYDLYRWSLLRQLGFTWKPADADEEWALWDAISRRTLYGKTDRVPVLPYDPGLRVIAQPPDVRLAVTRTVEQVTDRQLHLRITVHNIDHRQRNAIGVILRDALSSHFMVIANSCALENGDAQSMTGDNPYFFPLGDVAYGAVLTIRYAATDINGFKPTPAETRRTSDGHESGTSANADTTP